MDSQGRIKGKINIIDLIIIIVAVCAVAFIGYRYLAPDPDMVLPSKIQVKYYAEMVDDSVAALPKVGDPISDPSSKNQLGVITAVERGDSVVYNTDADGKIVKATYPGYSSLIITSELEAEKAANGIELNKAKYAIGHTFTMYCGNTRFTTKIYDIQVLN
ncbi:MAG: DUF4330 domain-containing protein [Clostridia bacterium]|nr:DUF4330 domain-containing protein [Clostridia bacterium]